MAGRNHACMKFLYSVLAVVLFLAICFQASVLDGDARARENRAYVKMLISVGQDLKQAEDTVRPVGVGCCCRPGSACWSCWCAASAWGEGCGDARKAMADSAIRTHQNVLATTSVP